MQGMGTRAWKVCESRRQLGGGALVLGTSFVQRKTPAVTGVAKAGGEGTAGGRRGEEGGENSKG